ncbi:protein kinase domain-containing protein [Roseateles sp. LKC17W]|uniref:Protein kinase n=1 Tax=Pelomonas margarita TaxID=3299031 RepID=A0ABW7FJG1_9BURK
MTPDELRRTSQLWDDMQALPEQAREAWLAALPAADRAHAPALRAMLALQADGATDPLTDGPPPLTAGPGAVPEQTAHAPGEQVGPYRLLRFLGRGGMGEVWLARRDDGPVGREVALKLPLMSARHPALRLRFERECTILSGLNHTHIATLFDAGVGSDGQVFMAMEYIEGLPLLRFCDERHLPLAGRIALALQLLDAVAHAHAHLVIHRDIKPANILVTPDGQLRLLDFGVAKILAPEAPDAAMPGTADAELTQWGGAALTLDYASPEQVQQQPVGTASDIHALGVVVYELLAGSRPYRPRSRSRRDIEAAILDPLRLRASTVITTETAALRGASLRALKAQLRGDLDTILAKALQLRPADRYATVAALADDLRRFLAREPIHARPARRSYIAWRFAQRHAIALGAVTAVVASMAVGTAVSVHQMQRARANEQLAQQEAARAQLVSKFLESVFAVNGRAGTDVLSARKRTARELLDDGTARLLADTAMAPAVRYELLGTMGAIYREMGIVETGAQLARQRVTAAVEAHGETSIEYAQAWVDLAWNTSIKGEGAEALRHAAKARAVLASLRQAPSEALASAWVRYAGVTADAGARVDLPAGRAAIADGRRWAAGSRDLAALSFLHMNAGILEMQTGRRAEGLASMREAMRLHEALGADQRAKGFALSTWLGMAELFNGNLAAARPRLEAGVRYAESTAVPVEEQFVYFGLWLMHDATGDLEQALRTATIAVDRVQQLPDALVTPEMRRPYTTAARAAWRTGRIELALRHLDSAQALHARKAGPETSSGVVQDLRRIHPDLWASTYIAAGRLDEASALLAAHDATLNRNGGFQTIRALQYYLPALELALVKEDAAAARALMDRWGATGPQPGEYPFYQVWTKEVLEGRVLTLEGRHAEAEALLRKVLASISARADHAAWQEPKARARHALGRLLLASGRAAEAREPLAAAAETFRRTQAPTLSLDRARTLALLAKAERTLGNHAAARGLTQEVDAIWGRHPSIKPRPDDRLAWPGAAIIVARAADRGAPTP